MTTTLLVTQVTGQAWIRGADGTLTALRPGMQVPGDADIVTAEGGSVQLEADGLPSMVIGENREVQLSAQAFETDVDPTTAAVGPAPDPAVAQVLAALNDGTDPFEELDPTAAVLPGGGGGAGGSNFTRLMDIVETTTPLGLEYPRPAGSTSISLMQGASGGGVPDNDDAPVQAPALQVPPPSLDIEDANALEPGQVTMAEDATGGASGRFTISAAAGLAFLTVGNTTLTAAQLGDLAVNPFTIQTAHGQIILTGFEPATGKVSYEYSVDGSRDHSGGDDTVNDLIAITVTDSSGRQASDSLGIHITDTEPVAQDDQGGQLVEDAAHNELSGNVMDNDEAFDGPGVVSWAGNANADVLAQLAQYGEVVLGTDGTWSFKLDHGKPATQALAEGQVVEFNLGYVLTDADGDSVDATLSFSVVGTNDGPVLSGDDLVNQTGADAQEITPVDVSGQFVDVDTSAVLRYAATGLPSGLQIDEVTGIIRGTLGGSASQHGDAGGPKGVYTITVTATDQHGASVSKTFTWQVSNPAPVAVDDTGAVDEDATLQVDAANGVLHGAGKDTDPDGDALTVHRVNDAATNVGREVAGTYGTLTLNADGSYTYVADKANALAAGQTAEDVFTYTVSDGEGGFDTAELAITVTGTNDVPEISFVNGAAVSVSEEGLNRYWFIRPEWTLRPDGLPDGQGGTSPADADTTNSAAASGTFNVSDVDNATLEVRLGEPAQALSSDGKAVSWTLSSDGQTLVGRVDRGFPRGKEDIIKVTLHDEGNGTYRYDVKLLGPVDHSDPSIEDVLNLSIPVAVSDGIATTPGTITVRIEDDSPSATDDFGGKVYEDAQGPGAVLGGNVLLNDGGLIGNPGADNSGLLDGGRFAWDTAANTTSLAQLSQYGSLTLSAGGSWLFTLNNQSVHTQALAEGQLESFTLYYTVTDNDGDRARASLTIQVQGTNDSPTLSATNSAVTFMEPDGPENLAASGELVFDDVDAGDVVTISSRYNDDIAWSGGQLNAGQVAALVGNPAAFNATGADGAGTWSYQASGVELDFLAAGQTITFSYTITATDSHNATAHTTVTVTIVGTNDGATITPHTPGDDAGAVIEDDILTTGGKLDVSDPDAGEASFIAQTGVAGEYGTFSIDPAGNWTYALDNNHPAVQALGKDETLPSESFTVRTVDGTASAVTVSITGTNDAPKISGPDAGQVREDGKLTADGQLSVSDLDVNDSHVWSIHGDSEGVYGTISVDANGKWVYTLDNTKPEVQALGANDVLTETFTVLVNDGNDGTDTHEVVITINGTNDAPVITSGAAVASVSEEGLTDGIVDVDGTPDTTDAAVATGQIVFHDIDSANADISVRLEAPPVSLSSHGTPLQWDLSQDGQTLIGTANGQGIIKVTIDDEGNYRVQVQGPVDHPDTETEDVLSLNVRVVVSDGKDSASTGITINIEDDSPIVGQANVVEVTSTGVPDVYAGMVSFAEGADQSGRVLTFANGAVEVTARGFTSAESLDLIAADVFKDSNGLGVDSAGAPYFPIPGEVDFRKTANDSASEELTIKLTGGKVAYGAKIGFADMFGGELEKGVAEFYRDGVLIAREEFTSDKSSGNYAAGFIVEAGGFDTVVVKALDNGNPHTHSDNSDFTVTSIEFLGTSEVKAFASAEGILNYQYGADGAGGIVLTGAEEGLKTLAGLDVTPIMVNSNLVQGRDSNDALVYELRLTPATGKWELFQYQYMAPGDDGKIDFSFKVTDADGDGAEGVFQVAPATAPANEVPVALGGVLIGNEDVSVSVTWASFAITDDSPTTDLGVTITGLPANGMLQYKDAGAGWKAVTEGQVISKADIDAGKLRFIPGANESGIDGFGGTVGNKADDYAHIKFSPTDGEHIGAEATLVIDITPVADKPNLSISLGEPSTTITNTIVVFGEHTFTIDESGVGASGTATVWNVLAGHPGNGKFNGTGNQSDIFVLAGDVTAAIKELNGAGGNHADDFVYLGKSREHYEIIYEKSNAHSRDYHGTIKDLDSGETVHFNNIEGLVYGDGTIEFGDAVVTTQGYETIAIDLAASLTDTDGSETLSPITLTGLLAGVTLLDGDGHAILPNADGSWTLGYAQLPGLSMQVPLGTAAFDVHASVTSTESVGGDAKTAEVSSGVQQHTVMMGSSQDDTLEGSDANDVVVADVTGLTVLPGQNYNIAFIVDTSGSLDDDAIASAKASLTEVFNALLQSTGTDNSGKVNIYLSDFDDGVRKMVSVDLADPQALSKLQRVLDSMASGGGTNYEAAFKDAANWFLSSEVTGNAGTNLTYFITDGKPTFYQSDEGGNPLVYTAQNGTQTNLSGLLDFSNYKPGDVVVKDGKIIVDADGNVSKWRYQSGGCNSGWKSESIGQITADGAGGYEFSIRAGTGSTTPTDTVSNSLAGFALLEDLSVVNAIGLGDELSIDDLKSYDTDGQVQTNIDPADLAAAILGSNETLPNGADTVHGGEGNDIIFGDAVSLGDIDGYNALKAYVADKANVDVHTLSNKDIHQYISDNAAEFDRSDARDGNDTLHGDAGDDILFGQGGDDLLYGGAGDDALYGGAGSDVLYGGDGDDYLIGGAGDDTLYGGAGADTFKWNAGDQGAAGAPAKDVIMDFDANEGDVLDLSSLLQDRGAGTLDHFLQASDDGEGGTIIHVSTDGGFAGGDLSAADQTIQLAGVEFNSAIVEQLINSGRLSVDAT